MNAADTIQAAIDQLEALTAEASDGPWTDHTTVGPYAIEAELFDGNGGYVIDDGYVADVRLIAALHRTIDAQLAILRGFHDHLTNPAWDHDDDEETAPVVVEVTALARAILGEAS